jgi:hypothetical protein
MDHPRGNVGPATALVAMFALGCSSGASHGAPAGAADTSSAAQSASCQPGATLTGAFYDIAKSRFAFGSTPVREDAGGLVRWVGVDGALAIWPTGGELGVMNAGAPEPDLPDWSTDGTALAAHVDQYFASMGVATCQIANSGIDGSASGGGSVDGSFVVIPGPSTVSLGRGVDGIRVVESLASARFNSSDQTTTESFYWPEVPATVVTAARALRDRLADATALAAYKALLPSDAQGDGQVVIHHSSSFSMATFQAAATYDVLQSSPLDDGAELSFDQNGNPVATAW